MAANENHNKQKKIPLKKCPKSILNVVPQNYSKITFDHLISGAEYENNVIIGKISHLYPLGKRADGFIRKIMVTDALSEEDENCEKKLAIFLFDQFAKDSEFAELGSYILISNFIVENVTNKKSDLPVQILVKKEETRVWFGRKVKKKAAGSATSETSHEAQKEKVSEEEEEPHAVSTHHYEYTKLKDLAESVDKETYNIFGIVEKCDLKVTSGKKKNILDLHLTDQTDTGFSCSVFAAAGETYPDIYPGDIVRIHRMQVSKFRGKLKGRIPDPRFMLVFSKSNDGEKPRTVAKTFTFTPEDITRCKELFTWYKAKSDPKLICDIQKDDFVTVICQVIGVYIARTTDAVILKIWDGTKTNIFPGVHWGMKDEKLDHPLFTVARNYYVVLSVYGHHTASAAEIQPTQYIEVQDAHLYSPRDNPDDFKLCLHAGNGEGRGITVLNESDERVVQLKERLDKVISDTLEFGSSQTDHILSQNNSIFLNCDISVFTSTQGITNGTTSGVNDLQNDAPCLPEEEVPQNNEDVLVLNEPLASHDANQENTVVSVVNASVKSGQSTQEFGLGMPRDETEAMDVENRPSVASEPDPLCNLTPLQTRYFFHDPQQSAHQMTDSIFPAYEDRTQEEWWKAVDTISVTEGHSDIKPHSLAEVVKHEVPYKFRVLAAVFCFKPDTTSIRKFIHLSCPNCTYITEDADSSFHSFERDGLLYYFCPVCSSNQVDKAQWPVLEYSFLLSLSLHDGSGPSAIEAYVWKENAVKFFKGITPEEVLKDSATADSLLHMLWRICPNLRPSNVQSSDYPILDCCILSYTAGGNTQYQIFDTILL